jgi:hypothetical protein
MATEMAPTEESEMATETAPLAAATVTATDIMAPVGATAAVATEPAISSSTTSIRKQFSINSSKAEFLALPRTDNEVHSIDTEHGLWVQCAVCDSAINNRAKPPAQTILLIAGSHSL